MLCELHKSKEFVENKFLRNGFSASYTDPENTAAGNHGGEVVALRSSYHSRDIKQDTIDKLEQLGKLRFAHKIVSFQSVEVLCVCVYLWHSEGLSERNNNILKQIYIIKNMLKLPILCLGDFNLTYDDFLASGWPQKLRVKMINPPVETTTSASRNRKIDFCFISMEIDMMYKQVHPIHSVVWGPHIGLLVELYAKPKSTYEFVQCIPRSLPMEQFQELWKVKNMDEQAKC